jgi:hypothetical protein
MVDDRDDKNAMLPGKRRWRVKSSAFTQSIKGGRRRTEKQAGMAAYRQVKQGAMRPK